MSHDLGRPIMGASFAKGAEVVANVSIIFVSLLLVGVLVRNYLWPSKKARRAEIGVGQQLDIPGVDWRAYPSSVVLVLREDCPFCVESAPFYKLLTSTALATGLQVIALLPEPVGDTQAFLEANGIRVSAARPMALARPAMKRTPTVLLVNMQGVVTRVWLGKLLEFSENEILQAVEATPGIVHK